VKVGTSLLTGGGCGLQKAMIDRLARQVARLREAGKECIIVTSGAIGAGLGPLGFNARPKAIASLQACAAVGQTKLMEAYDSAFRKCGSAVGQVLLTRECIHDRARYLNARNTLNALLDRGAVPVINENDTVSVDEIRFGDNDLLSALVTNLAEAGLLVILTDVPGFMTADPRADGSAKVVPTVERITDEVASSATVGGTFLGTGGMVSKVQAARIVTRGGVPLVVAGGQERNVLVRIVEGHAVGTLFLPPGAGLASRKQWIAYGKKALGALVVDDGARRALVERGKSLLPTGIVAVEGRFEEGDMVAVRTASGSEVARGLANFGSADVKRILGRKTSEISQILGRKSPDEVIHRDNLVLL
jgi:glutamate 5-kinase